MSRAPFILVLMVGITNCDSGQRTYPRGLIYSKLQVVRIKTLGENLVCSFSSLCMEKIELGEMCVLKATSKRWELQNPTMGKKKKSRRQARPLVDILHFHPPRQIVLSHRRRWISICKQWKQWKGRAQGPWILVMAFAGYGTINWTPLPQLLKRMSPINRTRNLCVIHEITILS